MKKLGGCPFQAFTHKNRILLRKNEQCIGNRKMKFWYVNTLFLWVLFAVLVLAPTTLGEVILFTSDSATQKLYAVDPTTGTSTSVGDFGVGGGMAGIAYDPANDVLYPNRLQFCCSALAQWVRCEEADDKCIDSQSKGQYHG